MTASPLVTPHQPTADHEQSGAALPVRHRIRPFAPAPVVTDVQRAPDPDDTQLQIADVVLQLLRTVNQNGLRTS